MDRADSNIKPGIETYDPVLFFGTILIAAFGVVMVYDSSAVSAALRDKFSNQYYFFARQLVWFFVGLLLMSLTMHIRIETLRRWAMPGLLIIYLLLLLVLIPGIGVETGGARRWLRLGPFSLQPGEPMRLFLILYMANFLTGRRDELRKFKTSLLPALTMAMTGAALLALQPKIGSALMIAVISFILFFVAGIPLYQMLLVVIASSPLLFLVSDKFDYIMYRIQAWLHPAEYVKNLAYQSTQSLIAIGSGGILGQGLGQGRQKMFYLPEAHTDFIFSVIAEELGFLGAVIMICGFMMILIKGISIALHSNDYFVKLLSIGTIFSVLMPVMLNLLVATGLFPVTGVPLPLISFGGSALVTDMVALGLLSRLAKEA